MMRVMIIGKRHIYEEIFVVTLFLLIGGVSLSGRNPTHIHIHHCGEYEMACKSGTCINRFLACDGIYHCEDGSDETAELCQKQKCPGYMFRCDYGACTRFSSICNGIYDCVDLSDEPPRHSCFLNNVPSHTSEKSTTKHYTPYPFPVSTATTSHQYPLHTAPTTAESTTKHYTPYPFPPSTSSASSKTTQTSTKIYSPHTVSTKPPAMHGKTSENPIQSPTPSYTIPPSTETTSDAACTLPLLTSDMTYTIDGCQTDSTDSVCQKKAGELINEGVALNVRCNVDSRNFTSYCLKTDWIPSINSCERTSCGNFTVNVRANSHVPWQGSVHDKSSGSYTCGAVILSPYAILSAAHCFYDSTANEPRSASDFYVSVGKKSRSENVKRSHIYNVTKIHFSSDGFQGSSTNYVGDIALLEVTPTIAFSSDVDSVCLDPSPDQYSKSELAGLISPYNDNGGNGYTETMRVTFTSFEQCVQMIEDNLKPLVTFDKICLLGRNIELGNGGNGLYTVKGGTSQYSHYRLRGLLSTTFHDSKLDGQVSTLTDIGKHLFWLPKALNEINKKHENETLIDVRGPFSS